MEFHNKVSYSEFDLLSNNNLIGVVSHAITLAAISLPAV